MVQREEATVSDGRKAQGTNVRAIRTLVCRACGYGIVLAREVLPHCPMCRTRAWRREGDRTRRLRVDPA